MALPTIMAFKECWVAILCIFNNFVLSRSDLCNTPEWCCVRGILASWVLGFESHHLPRKESSYSGQCYSILNIICYILILQWMFWKTTVFGILRMDGLFCGYNRSGVLMRINGVIVSKDFMWYLWLQGPNFEAKVAKLVELGFGRKQSYKLLNYLKEMKIRHQGFFLGVEVNIYL